MVGQSSEALLPGAAVLSCPFFLPHYPFSLLLPLRHGGADTWAGAGCTKAGSHRYVDSHGASNAELFDYNNFILCLYSSLDLNLSRPVPLRKIVKKKKKSSSDLN